VILLKYVNIDELGRVIAIMLSDFELVETDQQVKIPDDIEIPEDVTSGNYIYNKETKQFIKTGGG